MRIDGAWQCLPCRGTLLPSAERAARSTANQPPAPSLPCPLQLRELDVRSASAALPRIKPHWSHRWAAGAERLSCTCATAPAPHMNSCLMACGANRLTSCCIPLH